MSNYTDKEMKKKKGSKALGLCKKPISVEDEFIGSPVGPRKMPKDKKSDTTKDLEELRKQPMNIANIKRIIIRMEGNRQCNEKDLIKIYAMQGWSNAYDDFIIIIKMHNEKWKHVYFLDSIGFYRLGPFGCKDLGNSPLKHRIKYDIYNWLCENLDKVTLVK